MTGTTSQKMNWYLFGMKMNLNHAHKMIFWYPFRVSFKIFDHNRQFYMGFPWQIRLQPTFSNVT